MSDETKYFRVGIFVLLGLALMAGAVVLLGGGNFKDESIIFETYFDESVQGLEVGSPVKFRGVKLGTVSYIGFVEDNYDFSNDDDLYRYGRDVLVRMELVVNAPGDELPRDPDANISNLREMIDRGLRLRLSTQGLTGTAYIEADYLSPDQYPLREVVWKPHSIYVPSAESRLKSFSTAAERMFARLEAVEVERVLGNFDKLLVSMTRVADEIDLGSLEKDAVSLLADLRTTSIAVREALTSSAIQELPGSANEVLDELASVLSSTRHLVEGGRYDIETLMENLRVVSEDLRDLAGTAKAYPSFMLLGDAPTPATEDQGR